MISAILNGALFALKLIAFATIIFLFVCIALLLTFLLISNPKAPLPNGKSKTSLALLLARKRLHNSTQKIINVVLITPTSKQIKATKKQQAKTTKLTSKAPKKQPTKSMKLATQQTKKLLINMTSKELLAYAKQKKIKGYSSIYKSQKKPGLIKLIEQQPEFS